MPMFRPRRRGRSAGPAGSHSRVPISQIRRGVLHSALACAASALPNEFGGFLRSEEPGIITDLLLIPGTSSGKRHANLQLWMLPSDFSAVGTVHSHPSGALFPSSADLQLFRNWGLRHLILGRPFGPRDWRAYNGVGEAVTLTVLEDGTAPSPPPPDLR